MRDYFSGGFIAKIGTRRQNPCTLIILKPHWTVFLIFSWIQRTLPAKFEIFRYSKYSKYSTSENRNYSTFEKSEKRSNVYALEESSLEIWEGLVHLFEVFGKTFFAHKRSGALAGCRTQCVSLCSPAYGSSWTSYEALVYELEFTSNLSLPRTEYSKCSRSKTFIPNN